MTQTPRFALPLLSAGQAQKEVTVNEALARVDMLLQLAVESRSASSVPAAAVGQAWIVASGAVGAWAGHADDIALWDDAGWMFVTPRDGCIAFVRTEGAFVVWRDDAWRDDWPVNGLLVSGRRVLAGSPRAISAVTGGGTIDAEARAAISAIVSALTTSGILDA